MTRVSNYSLGTAFDWGMEVGREEGREGVYSQVPVAVTSRHLAACTSLQFRCKNHCAAWVGYIMVLCQIASQGTSQNRCVNFMEAIPRTRMIASLLRATVQH